MSDDECTFHDGLGYITKGIARVEQQLRDARGEATAETLRAERLLDDITRLILQGQTYQGNPDLRDLVDAARAYLRSRS